MGAHMIKEVLESVALLKAPHCQWHWFLDRGHVDQRGHSVWRKETSGIRVILSHYQANRLRNIAYWL